MSDKITQSTFRRNKTDVVLIYTHTKAPVPEIIDLSQIGPAQKDLVDSIKFFRIWLGSPF